MTEAKFRPPGDPLSGHVLKIDRAIPLVQLLPGNLREVWCASDGIRAVDRRQQGEVAAWVVHEATAYRHCHHVVVEPQAVVSHRADKILLVRPVEAGNATTVLASQIQGKGECRLGDAITSARAAEVLVEDTVVGMDAA